MDNQKIKPDIWYQVSCQASRENFIERCINEYKNCKVHPDSWNKAACLRYNSKTNTVNYRHKYDERYMGTIIQYHYTPKSIFDGIDAIADSNVYDMLFNADFRETQKYMEEKKMTPDYIKTENAPSYDPIVENYLKKEMNKIQQEGQKQREKIIAGSTLGKIVKSYYEAMETIKPGCYHDSIESMVPFDFLNEEEQKKIHDINEKEYARRQELSELREVIMFKLSFCKTLRERENVYYDYNLD